MSPFLQTVALYAPVVIIGALALSLLVVLWRRGLGNDNDLPLGEMLRRQGVAINTVWTRNSATEFGNAARRCASCGAAKYCRSWLDAGRREGYAEFCVNAPFIERMK